MTEKERVLSILDKYKLKAKKSFGQNFLINDGIIKRIIKSLDISSFDCVIEIGPGLGSLSLPISTEAKKFILVDADRDMISVLNDILPKKDNIKLIQSDFLKYNPDEESSFDNRLFVGNLPYNITSELIEYFLKCSFKKMSIMVQKEVALKLDYEKNKKDKSYIGAFLKTFGEYKIVTFVDSSSFYPQPKVDSAFISLERKKEIDFSLYPIYKALFKDPNKIILNCLKQYKIYQKALDSLQKNDNPFLKMRARQLDIDELFSLAKEIKNMN
ncbi:MAG: 16S rRNA (adenine(1518)-N(6)/adenine(1519)-N(6))-dimethyltransferase RsmA [Candidatus Enterosoma sp.]|nr:16S rRNA (adenine(1518)-N(6)/adenine(1519)-N(6))-dimethyltransferase RsmA [Candidatus Enterosoma sp.]